MDKKENHFFSVSYIDNLIFNYLFKKNDVNFTENNIKKWSIRVMKAFQNKPYWWHNYKPKPLSNPLWCAKADDLIVGAGYTRLSAAIELAKSDLKICVVDYQLPGHGAFSLNGGITSDHIRYSYKNLKKVWI